MSRFLQLEEDKADSERRSFHDELMAMPREKLVALAEEAIAAEIAATRLKSRLLQRVAASEAAIREKEDFWIVRCDQLEEEVWEMAMGASQLGPEMVEFLLKFTVQALIEQTGQKRLVMARFFMEQAEKAVCASSRMDPNTAQRGGLEDLIAEQFYLLCQLADRTPATSLGQAYYRLGRSQFSKQA